MDGWMYVCMYVCMYVMFGFVDVCMCVCMFVRMFVCKALIMDIGVGQSSPYIWKVGRWLLGCSFVCSFVLRFWGDFLRVGVVDGMVYICGEKVQWMMMMMMMMMVYLHVRLIGKKPIYLSTRKGVFTCLVYLE